MEGEKETEVEKKTLHLRDEQKRRKEDKQFRGQGRAEWPRVMGTTGVSMTTSLITEPA